MTSRTIVCSDCGEAVPYGRLSCPACGALLASVAGGSRPPGTTADLAPALIDEEPLLPDDRPLPMSPPPMGAYLLPGMPPPPQMPRVEPPPVLMPAPARVGPAAAPATAADASPDTTFARVGFGIDGLDVGLDRAIALGAGLVAIGLLLPWSRVVIGGGQDLASYFGTWGLAGPGHVLVLVVAVAIAVLTSVPNRVPVWLRANAAVALGGFVIGLLWPYVVGPLGASFGSLLDLVGALVLVAAGIAASWRARHAIDPRGV